MQSSKNQHKIDQISGIRSATNIAIIFLSGPTSLNTPLSVLREYDTICVNGSANHLIDNGITPFIYLVTDHNYFLRNTRAFFHQAGASQHTVISKELFDVAMQGYSKQLASLNPTIIRRACKSRKGGLKNYLYLKLKYWNCDQVAYTAPFNRREMIFGYSCNVRRGYFHTRTVAYAAVQLAETLGYKRTYFSGLDMTGSAGRFYEKEGSPCEKTTLDDDLDNILLGFKCMKGASRMRVYNLSNNTMVPYSLVPFADTIDTSMENMIDGRQDPRETTAG